MASKTLFASKNASITNTTNEAGGIAYSMTAKEALAQLAVTGCFNNTFYVKAEDHLAKVKDLAAKCDPEFVGKLAIYSREKGFLKDMPAFLVAYLSSLCATANRDENQLMQQRAQIRKEKRDVPATLEADIAKAHEKAERLNAITRTAFLRAIDNGKMLKNFVQIVRSGETGRKSLGTTTRNMIRSWFASKNDEQVFFQSIGNDPSLGDIVALTHPRPETRERAALFAHLLGKETTKLGGETIVVATALPPVVAAYEAFRKEPKGDVPKVPFEMVEGLDLSVEQWQELAVRQSWQSLRQRLNTFHRKGAFASEAVVKAVAAKLADEEAIRRAKAMPYQLLVTYLNVSPEMPKAITNALQDAVEIATRNIPVIDDVVVLMPDVSGSMHSSVTGQRVSPKTGRVETHTSKVRCIDVAALVAASFLRVNPQTYVIPFVERAFTDVRLNPKDSIMTNAEKLASLPYGGTNCSAALEVINRLGLKPALSMFVSDNESWVDSPRHGAASGSRTETMRQWKSIRHRRSDAKLVCNDIQPYMTTQAQSREDILNVGGFSDAVFEVVKQFVSGSATNWVSIIEAAA
jgi:60 kDa SS-A/Ro ribonucleoprotein